MNPKSLQLRTSCLLLTVLFFVSNCALAHSAETNVWEERRRSLPRASSQLARLPFGASHFPQFKNPAQVASLSLPEQLGVFKKFSHLKGTALFPLIQSIPSQYGTVRKILLPPRKNPKKIIIHILDIHQNLEAQTNISRILQSLMREKKVDLVALEGAFEPLNFSLFRLFPHKGAVKNVADYLFLNKKISGPVYSALIYESEIPAYFGVDDSEAYQANVDAYLESEPLIEISKK